MKKIKKISIILTIILLVGVITILIVKNEYRKNFVVEDDLETKSRPMAVMIEKEAGTGKYEESDSTDWPNNKDYSFNSKISVCKNGSKLKYNEETNTVNVNTNKTDLCYLYFDKREKNFDFTGSIQEYVILRDGVYKLEVWGAQGGATDVAVETGGLGGYATGEIELKANEKIYIVVGGQGEFYNGSGSANYRDYKGGYNGGGTGGSNDKLQYAFGGGGATHIAKISGLLSTLKEKQDQLLIVAGGGGGNGGYMPDACGGSGGGFEGTRGGNTVSPYKSYYGTGATQEKGGDDVEYINKEALGTFGQGGNYYISTLVNSGFYGAGPGGGGGYYGGGGGSRGHAGGGGGSGYIGNPLLKNKVMYCYQCNQSDKTETKTLSTDNKSENPVSTYAKSGNGYARITLVK